MGSGHGSLSCTATPVSARTHGATVRLFATSAAVVADSRGTTGAAAAFCAKWKGKVGDEGDRG